MRMSPCFSVRQRGAAILMAMLVVTLSAVVISGLFWREQVSVRSVQNRLALAQARWIERAAMDWAKVVLMSDQRLGQVDHFGEAWALPVLETRLDETVTGGARLDETNRDAVLAGQIFDAQARFNLNSLSADAGQASALHRDGLRKLLTLLGRSDDAADRITERVLQAQPRTVNGATVPPTRGPLLRVLDLLDVPGLDPQAVRALEPFCTVLPRSTPVNINTAPAEVIAALVPSLSLASAQRFVSRRERTFYRSLDQASQDFDERPVLPPGAFGVSSGFFMVTGVIRYDRVESQSDTLLERLNDRIEVLWQQRR
jgi:general secretion pathway protein K